MITSTGSSAPTLQLLASLRRQLVGAEAVKFAELGGAEVHEQAGEERWIGTGARGPASDAVCYAYRVRAQEVCVFSYLDGLQAVLYDTAVLANGRVETKSTAVLGEHRFTS